MTMAARQDRPIAIDDLPRNDAEPPRRLERGVTGMLKSVARNAMRPSYLPGMTRKIWERVLSGSDESREAHQWASAVAVDMAEWARRIDADTWTEAERFAEEMAASALPRVEELRRAGIGMGGGGAYNLLYFLTRHLSPENVLETGVAAGWSTHAFLSAIEANGHGSL